MTERFAIDALPASASAAAARFHGHYLPLIERALAAAPGALTIVFPPADHTHRAWREAAVQTLAREAVPVRVNALAGGDAAAQAAALAYLAGAPGVTGQYLPLDSAGAGAIIA